MPIFDGFPRAVPHQIALLESVGVADVYKLQILADEPLLFAEPGTSLFRAHYIALQADDPPQPDGCGAMGESISRNPFSFRSAHAQDLRAARLDSILDSAYRLGAARYQEYQEPH